MVSDSKDITPRTVRAHNLGPSSVTTAKVGKKIIHTEAADPTVASDAGTGFEVGSLWNNTSSGEIFICASSSEEDANWKGQDGNNINDPFALQGSTYGFIIGGDGPVRSDKVTRFTFAAPSDASDVAEMLGHRTELYQGSIRNSTHAFVCGGYSGPGYGTSPGNRYDVIGRVSLTSPYAETDVGEMTETKDTGSSLTDGTKGLLCGGQTGPNTHTDMIEQFTLGGSPITATDTSSELSGAINGSASVSDAPAAKGYIMGGQLSPPAPTQSTIEGIPIGISPGGSTSDYGELSASFRESAGAGSPTHGYNWMGQNPSYVNAIEKFPFGASGSSSDVGESTFVGVNVSCCQSTTAIFGCLGLDNPGTVQDKIDKMTYASDTNATDVGEAVDALRWGNATEV